MNSSKTITTFIILMTTTLLFSQTPPQSPKNIILFISDGCGINQITATDYYQYGATNNVQVYEQFPVQHFMSTYMGMNKNDDDMAEGMEGGYAPDRAWSWFDYVKKRPTDSAASATAIATGKKTYKYAIGVDVGSEPLENLTQRAELLSKSTGVVTSVEWSHATPASFAAHNKTRDAYEDIAKEMLFESGLDVIMGAGHPWYNADGEKIDTSNTFKYVGGEETWEALTTGTADNWTFIESKDDFDSLMTGDTPERVIGTAQVYQTLQQKRSGDTKSENTTDAPFTDSLIESVPTLQTMTAGALNVLDNNPNGFFLMVEGGAIDWAAHDHSTPRVIEEQIDFNHAVEQAVAWVQANSNWDETLIIVTSDHETGYLTGPNAGPDDETEGSADPTFTEPLNNGSGALPTTQWHSDDHTNQLVPLYAKGPGSDLLTLHADEYDIKRGRYLTNSEIGQSILTLWPTPQTTIIPPKNIILMIADGCGENEILAADFYQNGEAHTQIYDEWPINLYMSTFMAFDYDADHLADFEDPEGAYEPYRVWSWFDYVKRNYTDSAASASAFATGKKAYKYSMGLDMFGNPIENIVELAEKKGKATGSISTIHWTHATPAAMVVHAKDRNNYDEIGIQMVYDSGLDVIMGAGHPWYDDNNMRRSSANSIDKVGGEATWNDLLAGTAGNDADGDGVDDKWAHIDTKELFELLIEGPTPKRVIGTAMAATTLQEKRSGETNSTKPTAGPYTDAFNAGVPDLPTMTKAALNVLDNDEDGFFIMIEGGAVDWAGHSNYIVRDIEEKIDFNYAIEAVVDWIETNSSWDETLVIVTGDHETGYLTGPGSGVDDADESTESDVWTDVVNNGKGNLPGVEWHSDEHTNQLIPIYAKGAGSELFHIYADQYDEKRGYFTDNAEVGQVMNLLMKMNPAGNFIVEETAAEFALLSASDAEGDEGKKMRLTWVKHPLESEGKITQYDIYRLPDTTITPDKSWELVEQVPASGLNFYTSFVATEHDFNKITGPYNYTYFIRALTNDPETWYDSEQKSGYSMDNKAPSRVSRARVEYTGEGNLVTWRASRADDFMIYNVHKSDLEDFEPSAETLLTSTLELEYLDTKVAVGEQWYYGVTAVDSSGNEGDFAVLDIITGVESRDALPREYALQQNFPNPFNPATHITFSIPENVHVKLTVYNTLGQIVETLIDRQQAAGQYTVQWDAARYSSGVYLYKMEAADKVFIKKMQLIK